MDHIHRLATVHPTATIMPSAIVEAHAMIGPGVFVDSYARVCARAILWADSPIGEGMVLGMGTQVRQHGSVGMRGQLEYECIVGEGAQVGGRARFDTRTRVNDGVHVGNGVKSTSGAGR